MALGAALRDRWRPWWSAALAAAGLLVVPLLVWLILPAPPKIAIPQIIAATIETGPTPPPRPKVAPPPVRAPRPAETATATTDESAPPVRGRVLGPDGAGVMRALVACTDREISTVTDGDGSFELPPEAAGCLAAARRPGFGTSSTVTLSAGDPRANTLELRSGGRIEGTVVDEKGAPVTTFMLAVEKFIGAEGDDEGSNGRARTVESPSGAFTMENVTPGKYVLSVSSEGRPPARTDTLEVEAGRTVAGVRIVLSRGAVLSGTITDAETKQPIEGARISLDSITSSGVSYVSPVHSDATGAYALEGAPVNGPFSIRVSKDGYRARVVSGLQARSGSPVTSDVQLQPRGENSTEDSELGGIGAALGPHPAALGAVVVAVTPDSPAARAGMQRLDWIVRIDGVSTETMTLVDCIQRLRGPAGTRVSVTVNRNGQEIALDLTRDTVVVKRPGR